jgi:hypothetical protein
MSTIVAVETNCKSLTTIGLARVRLRDYSWTVRGVVLCTELYDENKRDSLFFQ